jgi:hypothetical protein
MFLQSGKLQFKRNNAKNEMEAIGKFIGYVYMRELISFQLQTLTGTNPVSTD